ncbi:Detected protein of unknown function [Hibiscus syriacus]|uniref:Uncharacterized protein n=1 Tax=Hibiscus syriacus TaxID=106335 RepID=A0A6A2YFE5_HIBSY|nr:Detected protein of unknown function [Hibiscus syriacus]
MLYWPAPSLMIAGSPTAAADFPGPFLLTSVGGNPTIIVPRGYNINGSTAPLKWDPLTAPQPPPILNPLDRSRRRTGSRFFRICSGQDPRCSIRIPIGLITIGTRATSRPRHPHRIVLVRNNLRVRRKKHQSSKVFRMAEFEPGDRRSCRVLDRGMSPAIEMDSGDDCDRPPSGGSPEVSLQWKRTPSAARRSRSGTRNVSGLAFCMIVDVEATPSDRHRVPRKQVQEACRRLQGDRGPDEDVSGLAFCMSHSYGES